MAAILVVDDESGILDTLVDILADEGFSMTFARNGREALQSLEEHRPDLVLIDYMMPVMSGAETLTAMRAEARHRDIPVIMMSAVDRSSLPEDCRPDGFLRKPFHFDELLSAIERALRDGD